MAASIKIWVNNDTQIECEDKDLNGFKNENNNLIISSDQTLDINNNQQTAAAVAYYGAGGDYYIDSGAANAYLLNPPPSRVMPLDYFEGFRISFKPQNSNTGASTVKVGGLGVVDLVLPNGQSATSNSIILGEYVQAFYDGSKFKIIGKPHSVVGGGYTGEHRFGYFPAPPEGWILHADGTIGNAASGATVLADEDARNLFIAVYTVVSDANAPVSGGRSGDATTDFDAGKTLLLPPLSGRAVGVSGSGSGLTARDPGSVLGEETHLQTEAEVGQHKHKLEFIAEARQAFATTTNDDSFCEFLDFASETDTNSVETTVPFNVMQPTTFMRCIIKL